MGAVACTSNSTSPSSSALDLTGTWHVTFSQATPAPGTLNITQTGSSLTVTNPNLLAEATAQFAPYTVVVNNNGGSGTISGSSVTMTRAYGMTLTNGKNTVTITVSNQYTLTATSTTMTGAYSFSQTCQSTNVDACAPNGPFSVPSASGTATFAKQ